MGNSFFSTVLCLVFLFIYFFFTLIILATNDLLIRADSDLLSVLILLKLLSIIYLNAYLNGFCSPKLVLIISLPSSTSKYIPIQAIHSFIRSPPRFWSSTFHFYSLYQPPSSFFASSEFSFISMQMTLISISPKA